MSENALIFNTPDKPFAVKGRRYTKEQKQTTFKDIINQIAFKGVSLESLVTKPEYPSRATFFKWVGKSNEMMNDYARACIIRTAYYEEKIIEISQRAHLDYYIDPVTHKAKVNGEAVQSKKLEIDTLKWIMSKVNPKKYGDMSQIQLTGANGGSLKVESIDYSKLDADTLKTIIAAAKPTNNEGSDSSI